MSKPIIEVEGLSKSYQLGETVSHDTLRDAIAHGFRSIVGGRGRGRNPASHNEDETLWALKDVSFNVNEGDVLGIIGRNGAGKSTLLKILSRITDPTSGTARIRGRVASLLEVGTGFHPELTGRENIFLNGAILGMTRSEMKAKFDEIVAFAEVERFIDTPVKRYSSGMYVRLAFAVAAHIDPEILIVDEVLAVGDAAFQKKCLGKMEDVSKGGRTVLFVSHNMPMIRCLTNKIMLLKNGRMAEFGGATSTIEKYLTENNVSKRDTYELLSFPRSAGTESAISKAWMESSKSATISEIAMGKFIRICFEFKLKESKRNILLGFGIENSDGLRIFSLNNVISNNVIEKDLEEGVAVFEIPELPLLPGTYFVSMSIVEAQGKWIDFIERAFSFNVIPDDVFGSGRIIEKSQGVVFVKGKVFNEVKIAANGHTKT